MFRPIKTLGTGQNLIIKFCSVFIKATDLSYSQLSEACTFWTLGIIFNHVLVIITSHHCISGWILHLVYIVCLGTVEIDVNAMYRVCHLWPSVVTLNLEGHFCFAILFLKKINSYSPFYSMGPWCNLLFSAFVIHAYCEFESFCHMLIIGGWVT